MEFSKFRSPNAELIIKKQTVMLSTVSLLVLSKIEVEFGSFEKFHITLSIAKTNIYDDKFVDCITKFTYFLLEKKDVSFKAFRADFLNESQENFIANVGIIFENITNSSPEIQEESEGPQPTKKKNDKEEKKENISDLYVFVAREIPQTIDEFYNLNLRQLGEIVQSIGRHKNIDRGFLASLQGLKLNNNEPLERKENPTLDNYAKKRFEELQNKFKNDSKT